MSRSTVFRKTKPVQKSFTLTHQDVDSDSEYHDVRLSSNDRRIPRFGGQNDGNYSGNEDIENYVEQPGLGTEEDETELLTELRQLSRNLTTARPTKQKLTDRYVNTVEDLSPPKKTVKEFNEYYHKSVNKFLQKKKEDLEKIKKLKEETEAQELRHKPTLIAKQQQNMRHIPIAERAELVKAKKERDILRMKKEQEERLEKEFRELTFAPRTNHSSVSPVPTRKREIGSNFKKNDEGRERNEGKRLMKKAVNKNNENCRKQGSDEIPKNTSNNPGSQTKTVDEKKRKSPMQEQTLNARLATEPCNQTVQERFNSQEPNKSNRGLSTERSKSPLEAKTKKKKDMRESNSLVNREQEVKNRQMEEEKLMKRYHQMLDDDLKRVTDASMHKKDIKRSSVSSNSVSNNISRKSPVESYENNDQEVKRENNRSPSPSIVKEKEVTSNKINQENKLENKKDNVRPEDEVVEIESIKQNLLSIQDNLQTLKQSFRSFQTAQPIPKAYLSFIDSPKEIKTGMDDRKQSLEKKMFLENEQSRRSTSPLPNSKTSQDTSLELHNVTKKPIRYQYTGTLNICKDQLIDNDTESFGNGEMSFSAAYDLKLEEKNLRTQSKPSMSMNVDIKKEDSIFSWKEISENELRQSEGLDRNTVIEKPGNNSGHTIQNLLSRKQADHSESLKDISQMALKKFKRVDRQQAI